MVFFVCDCGFFATTKVDLANARLCVVCGSSLKEYSMLPLSFFTKHKSFVELDEDALVGRRKQVLEAIKILQPCTDRDIKKFTGLEINQVTPRRFELANASFPLIKPFGSRIDETSKKEVTLWVVV